MAEGRTKKSIRNILYRLVSQIVSILLRFVSRSVFIHILGVEYLGINGLFSELLQMLSMADLGFGTAMVFSMYKPLAEHDETKLTQLVQLYRKIYTIIATIITVIGVALVPFLPHLVKLDEEIPYLRIYYLLYLANTVSSYLVVYKTCILNADQKNYIIARNNTLFSFLSLFGTTVALILTHNFMAYLVVQVFFTYANNFYTSHLAEQQYPYIKCQADRLPDKEAKEIFDNVKSVFLYKLASTFVNSVDNTLISVIIGTVMVGYYSNYRMIIGNVELFINIFFSSVTASLGNLIVESNQAKNYAVYKKMQMLSFILCSIAVSGTYLLIDDFITVWLGQEYVLSPLVVLATVVNMYFSIVLMPIWSYREATGLYQQTKYVMVFTASINLILSILLGSIMGLSGILLATSIARLSTYFWYEPKLLFGQFFGRKVTNYYKKILENICITIATCLLCSLAFRNITVESWFDFTGKMCIIGVTASILVIVLYARKPEFKYYLNKMKGAIK